MKMRVHSFIFLFVIASARCNTEIPTYKDRKDVKGLDIKDDIEELFKDYINQYKKLTHVDDTSKDAKDSLEEYLKMEPIKINNKDETGHRRKRAASYYSGYSAEPYGGGGYSSGRGSYSPKKSYNSGTYSRRPSSSYGKSYGRGTSYYSPSSGYNRNTGGRAYYSPQSNSYGSANNAGQGSSHAGYGNNAYQNGGNTNGGYAGSYAPAYSGYGAGGGGYGAGGGYADPGQAAQGGYDANDPFAGYPDEALTKYLEDILKKSSSEEESGSNSKSKNGRRASVESRDASEGSSEESGSKKSKEESSENSDERKKKMKKRKSKKSKSNKKGKKKSGSRESQSSEDYDYSEEELPILTRKAKPLDLAVGSHATPSPAWYGTTSSPEPQHLGLNSPVSRAQAGLLFNQLLGNFLQNAMKHRTSNGILTSNVPSTTPAASLPLYTSQANPTSKKDISQELAELGFLIKNTFRKMASQLDNLKDRQSAMKEMTNAVEAVPSVEAFENSRGNAYINLPKKVNSPSHRAERSTETSSSSDYHKASVRNEKHKLIKVKPLKRVYKLPSLASFHGITPNALHGRGEKH